ncbi:hypothetical protein DLAC_08964 [Tieghemostelium lacteum]|uniref:Pectin lyase-like family protein n=1 Tax=Tieghemostelium lacteum TaxID=361077 RepID=A0A151Z8R5_TIELA|nr:hypothetical protein DLAC_08964 [Tieghemostelium lacteum]|eukprot:KYQ90350.1 hypothetical protein DLAC_08964 [Tieghemostelium lacteum]
MTINRSYTCFYIITILIFNIITIVNGQYVTCDRYIRPLENKNDLEYNSECGFTLESPCISISKTIQNCNANYPNLTYNIHFRLEEGVYILTDDDLFPISNNIYLEGQLSVIFDFSNIHNRYWIYGRRYGTLSITGITFTNITFGLFHAGTYESQSLTIQDCQFINNNIINQLISLSDINHSHQTSPTVQFKNVTFQNNKGDSHTLGTFPLIYFNNQRISASNLNFQNNYGFETLMSVENGYMVIDNSEFINNTISTNSLIAIINEDDTEGSITNCKFIGNGCIYSNSSEINQTTVSVVKIYKSNLKIDLSQFINNSIPTIIVSEQNNNITIFTSTFIGNIVPLILSTFNDTLIDRSYSTVSVSNSNFNNNTQSLSGEYGIFYLHHSSLNITQSKFIWNKGDMININESIIVLNQLDLMNNQDFVLVNCSGSEMTILNVSANDNDYFNPNSNGMVCVGCSIIQTDENVSRVCYGYSPYYTSPKPTESSGLTNGQIAGIVIGIILIVSLIIGGIIIYKKRNRRSYPYQYKDPIYTPLISMK